MRGRGRVTGQCLRIAKVDQSFHQFQRVVKFRGGTVSAAHAEGDQRARASTKISLRELVIWVVFEADVIDLLDALVRAQELGHAACVLYVALNSKRDGLDSLEKQKRAQRR